MFQPSPWTNHADFPSSTSRFYAPIILAIDLLNTPQQRSFSRVFDVSYQPCSTILLCFGISGQHVLVYVFSFPISFYFYNFEYTPHSISDATWFFGDACVGPPGGIQPERVRHWRALSYWFLSIYIRGISAAYWLYLFQAWYHFR